MRRPPDVLFVPSHVLPAFRRSPSVATIHDLGYLRFPSAHSRSRWWYLHFSTMFNASGSRLVIADSFATRDDIVRFYRTPSSKIRVVHLGNDPRFRPQSDSSIDSVRVRYGLDGRFLLAVGTLQPRKNLARLFEAFAQARTSLPTGMRLAVAGARGFAAEEVENRARQLGDSVTFLGYVPDDDVPSLMCAADALVFPSLSEGFGLPALEAMACGTPVVCSNTSSLPEVVGNAALMIDSKDISSIAAGLVRIAGDADLRVRLRRDGPLRAALFTWENTANRVLDVLEEAAR